ncbi:OB-fold domain-containing protein [Phenylobacterium sp. J426]|uniref:thiolase C-terminal domain-containing protein n=1 Tax=Phenylobacterium sp. J426 TaxID=2898439 RepID=UPI002151EC3F|nr:OB-fold domain-containing protein [Phenylobacterium sp. J426]MCR5876788.1 OB-fold domain-containing protein [Phenylobacterium sp. J426]
MGITPRMGGAWDQGGAANISLITFAALAIEAGQCEVALVCYADNPRSGPGRLRSPARGEDAAYGWFSTAAGYAMIHQRYLIEYAPPPEAFGEVAVAARANGAANPRAQLRKPISMDDYLASPFVVEPMRRDDICLVSDGGAALVLMSAERAKRLGVARPVPILGFGHGQTSAALINRPTLTSTQAKVSAETAFRMAGLGPADVDVAQIYDCFTITVLMTLEDYGFCPPGQAEGFVREGRLRPGGDLPFNTSGGLLSETGMPGLQLVQEAVRQMRGEAVLQTPGAEVALISNQGGDGHPCHADPGRRGVNELPRPDITELNAPYWTALGEGRLVFQACACGRRWLPPRRECPACLRDDQWAWQEASGRGTLVSWVVYHAAYHPAFAARTPYNVAIVALEEGPRLIANIDVRNEDLRGDMPVRLAVAEDNGVALARFRPA